MVIVENNYYFEILNTYFQKKYFLLIFIKDRQKKHKSSTVLDIVEGMIITQNYAYNLLEALEREGRVKKGKKIRINGKKYYNYVITKKARDELKVISESTD